MAELRDVRDVVRSELTGATIDAWVFEADAGARPDGVRDTSLKEVELADIYLGLFWKNYGHVTIEEYKRARKLIKPCFIYIRDKNIQREQALEDFLRDNVYDVSDGVTYAYFDSSVELGKQVTSDILAWLVRQHRETKSMREEAYERFNQATHELEDTLLQITRKLEKNNEESLQKRLHAAQEEWEKFRDANAEFMADVGGRGTSLRNLIKTETLADMTKARTLELRKSLER